MVQELRTSLNPQRFTDDGDVVPAQDAWGKRWMAHVLDLFSVVVMDFFIYFLIAMPIVRAGTDFNELGTKYETAVDNKLSFLMDMDIMVENEDGDSTLTDEEMAEKFIGVYLSGNLGDSTQWNDPLMNYYLNKAATLTPYDESVDGYDPSYAPSTQPKSLDQAGYNELILSSFNSDETIFVENENGDLEFEDDGSESSPRYLIATYTGIGLKEGEAKVTTDDNSALFSTIEREYVALREQASLEALSSSQEMPNEIVLSSTYDKILRIRSYAILVSHIVSFVIVYQLPAFFFKYGRSVSKRIFGFYVISRNGKKAKPWQYIVRDLISFLEQFWSIAFSLLLIFGTTSFYIPFVGSVYYLPVIIGSLLLFLASAICSFVSRKYMLSFHDYLSFTKCLKLRDKANIQDVLKIGENKKDSDLDEVKANIEGEKR